MLDKLLSTSKIVYYKIIVNFNCIHLYSVLYNGTFKLRHLIKLQKRTLIKKKKTHLIFLKG